MIILEGIKKSFGGRTVIPQLNLEIPKGETHILLGSSGCGKTTILRMICGLLRPDEGRVYLGPDEVGGLTNLELSQKLGYVVQEGGLFPHMTARENILFSIKMKKGDMGLAKERLHYFREMVHLEDYLLDKYPKQLSGGQRQRVALIRGLIGNPDIILLDEPLSALDPVVRMGLQQDLRDIFRELKKTVVMVTHDLSEAAFLGDVINLIHEGKIIQQGPFKELRDQPINQVVEEFVNAQISWEGEG